MNVEMALGCVGRGESQLAGLEGWSCSWKPAHQWVQKSDPAPAKPALEMLLWKAEILQINLKYKRQHWVNLLNADPASSYQGKS